MSFLVGTSVDGNNGILSKELSEFGRYVCISDNGKPGRILENLDDEIRRVTADGTDIKDVAYFFNWMFFSRIINNDGGDTNGSQQ